MKLRSSRIIHSYCAEEDNPSNVRINAHRKDEDAYRPVVSSLEDVSSISLPGEPVVGGQLRAESSLSTCTDHGRRKWSYAENTKLMHCYHLTKRQGRGYRDHLKHLWDSQNPGKESISTNVLCCHARNIQTSGMLTVYELTSIREKCSALPETNSVITIPTRSPTLDNSASTSITSSDVADSPCGPVSAMLPEAAVAPHEVDSNIFDRLKDNFAKVVDMELRSRPQLRRVSPTQYVKNILLNVNHCVEAMLADHSPSLLECDQLLFAAALTVVELASPNSSTTKKCAWRQRLESQIMELRRDISRLVAIGYPPSPTRRLNHLAKYLFSRYHITSLASYQIAVETLKQRITCVAARLRKYKLRLLRQWQNSLFSRNERAFYANLQKSSSKELIPPDIDELKAFWQGVFEKDAKANLQSTWIQDLGDRVSSDDMSTNEVPNIDADCLICCIRKLRNWAAPGPDGVQVFWIKRMSVLHSHLLVHFQAMLRDGTCIPGWLPCGRTVLIPKSIDSTQPKNYRPITCLNVLYKLWSSCLTHLITGHCQSLQILHPSQKGCAPGQFGCIDHLLLNSRVWHQVKSKNRSLSIAWLDIKKAYDSVPHNWILCCLRLYRFHRVIIQCVEHLLLLWQTTLYLQLPSTNPVRVASMSIKCGIFQGDTLSPLLFCIALNPLSMLLDPLSGYQVAPDQQLTHLLYMDDLKLFARNDTQLHILLRTVKMFSDDVGLTFGMDKCAKLSVSRGKAVETDDLVVHDDFCIRELNTFEAYKYLGFFEREGTECDTTKKAIVNEYERRLTLVWKSYLSGPRKVRATNSLCVPIVSFSFGIIPWTKKEIQHFDIVTRRIMTSTCNHHPRSAVERLYLPRSGGGRGLVNVENLYNRRLVVLAHHLCSSSDSLVKLCHKLDNNLPPRCSVILRANTYCSSISINADWKIWPFSTLKKELRKCEFSQLMGSLLAKPLHGKFQSLLDSEEIDASLSTCWLRQHLHSESESTVCAIQDQVISTRVYESKIMGKSVATLSCRICGQAEETIIHLLCACSALASSVYLYRHNLVAQVLHWHLSRVYSLPLSSKSWYNHTPMPVCENSAAKLLWDFGLVTGNHHSSNRPDIVLFDFRKSSIQCFEVSCPADTNVISKEMEKVQKYQPLVSDLRQLYSSMSVETVPVVIGHTGVVTSHCKQYLKQIPGFSESLFYHLQKATLLGTIHILHTLNL